MFKLAVFLLSIFRLVICQDIAWPVNKQLKPGQFSHDKESFTLITSTSNSGDLWSSVPEMSFDVVEVEQIVYKDCARRWSEIDLNINKLECTGDSCPQFWNLDINVIPSDFHFPPFQHDGRCAYLSGSSSDWRLGATLKYSELTETCIPLADFKTNHIVDLDTDESCQPQMKLLYTECQERVILRYQVPFPAERKPRRPRTTLTKALELVDSMLAACSVEISPMEVFEYCRDHEIMVNMNHVNGYLVQLKSLLFQPKAVREINPEDEELVFFPDPRRAEQCIIPIPFRDSSFNCTSEIFSKRCEAYDRKSELGQFKLPVYDTTANRLVASYRCLKE